MSLTLIHTAEVHRATFEALRDRIAPGAVLRHVVRADWLARAQGGIDGALTAEITEEIAAAGGKVLCSCTTLGPVAGAAGAIRIDQPMMQAAAEAGGAVMLAYCLRSTEGPSLALLRHEMAAAGNNSAVVPLFLGQHWPLFEAGDGAGFAHALAASLREAILAGQPGCVVPDCVVLAQASMAGAAEVLGDLGVPVLSSPALALRAGLAV
ncbi:hypothetical protein [Thalassovita taeanensis]|uniref:Asp/Glu/Hydantoin racemase n=1 Tax=Thalassovita taeanensis TaxID=657014 RepID=A0A1H9CQV0_9RHOB|nr:hypothetical protein [Thalassovita taeanensis]SEQ03534.1 hypothetical protein SAMN04488092_103353 [Thalassovita taeanensis]